MKSNEIVNALNTHKGQHIKVTWERACKVRKSAGAVNIRKRTVAYVRTGIDYANLAEVKEAIAAQERGEVQPIWNGKGQWTQFPFVFAHVETGAEYMRFYPASFDNLRPQAIYLRNGAEVEFDAIKGDLLASELPSGEVPSCYCVKAGDVVSIGAD